MTKELLEPWYFQKGVMTLIVVLGRFRLIKSMCLSKAAKLRDLAEV